MNILFPGSFNPFHEGHKEILDKTKLLFPKDNIHIVSFLNPNKPILIQSAVEFPFYSGTIDDYCKKHKIDLIVRGMRTYKDPQEDQTWLDYVLASTECIVVYIKSSKVLESVSSTNKRETND